jgi:hypothetical protein
VAALLGLWGSQQSFPPTVRGELTVDARGNEWRARIAGYDVPVEHLKDEIHFALPGEAGKFRGRLHLGANGKRIFGHWIQLGGVAFYSYSYASPVELTELAPGVWRGDVVPLDERASFYISIERTPDGSLKAFFRNPEANRFRGQTFDVALQDGTVTLLDKGQAMLRWNLRFAVRRSFPACPWFLSAGAVRAPGPEHCAWLLPPHSFALRTVCLPDAGCGERWLGDGIARGRGFGTEPDCGVDPDNPQDSAFAQ